MLKKRLLSHICIFLSCLLLCGAAFGGVLASGEQAQLTVYCKTAQRPVAGVRVSLYRIGAFSGGKLLPTAPYTAIELPAVQTDSSQTVLASAGETLQAFVEKNNIQPTASALSDTEGRALFTSLGGGVYLILADFGVACDAKDAVALPALAFIPEQDANETQGTPEVYLKIDEHPQTPTEPQPTSPTTPGEPTEPGGPTAPPTPGEPTEPGEPTAPTKPGETTKPGEPTAPTKPGEPTKPTKPGTPTEPSKKRPPKEVLPHTGQLWWPVPVLAAEGLICFGCGAAAAKKKRETQS